jgi:CubicO group peptidase (beta-lactamase class C family)
MSSEKITTSNWGYPPYNRSSFQFVQELFPTSRLRRNPTQRHELPVEYKDLSQLSFSSINGTEKTVETVIQESFTDAFLVVHKGTIVMEHYDNGMDIDSLHLVNSITKSFVGMLAGIAEGQGLLDPSAPISAYLQELSTSSAWSNTSVRDVLDMTAGVSYGEDYADPNADFWKESAVVGWRPQLVTSDTHATLLDYIVNRDGKDFEDGEKFIYKTICTNVLGHVLQRVMGRPLQSLLEEHIWQPLSPRNDAAIVVDQSRFPYVGAGLNATARDLARFGQMIIGHGTLDGSEVVPASWIEDTFKGDSTSLEQFKKGQYGELMSGHHYRNQIWVSPNNGGTMAAIGIHGQAIFMNPDKQTVIVKLSSQPESNDMLLIADSFLAMDAIVESL